MAGFPVFKQPGSIVEQAFNGVQNKAMPPTGPFSEGAPPGQRPVDPNGGPFGHPAPLPSRPMDPFVKQLVTQLAAHKLALLGQGASPEQVAALSNIPTPTVAPPSGQIDSGYNPAETQRALGNTGQAAADWEAHHPYAMAHHQIPGWVEKYAGSTLPHLPGAPPAPRNPRAVAASRALGLS